MASWACQNYCEMLSLTRLHYHHPHQIILIARIILNVAIPLYRFSLLVGPLTNIPCLCWSANTSIPYVGAHRNSLMIPFFFNCSMVYETKINGPKVAVLSGAASRICLKQQLCNWHMQFYQSASLKFRWGSHTTVRIRLQFARNPIFFYVIDQIYIWSITCRHYA